MITVDYGGTGGGGGGGDGGRSLAVYYVIRIFIFAQFDNILILILLNLTPIMIQLRNRSVWGFGCRTGNDCRKVLISTFLTSIIKKCSTKGNYLFNLAPEIGS